ncbi:MAG: hypothetical protein Q9184_007399, partial [Pyrenodesmia sp. 2 TL-2023]
EKERVKHDNSNPSSCVFLRMKNATHANLEEKRESPTKNKLHEAPTQAKRESSIQTQRTKGTSGPPQPIVYADSLAHADTLTFEEAIQSSVKATSRGDAEQDALIERAIRASVLELHAATKAGDQDRAVQRAIQASVAEATRAREAYPKGNRSAPTIQAAGLRSALQRSLTHQPSVEAHANVELDDSEARTGDDDQKPGLTESKAVEAEAQCDDDEAQLKKAKEQSRLDHEQHVKFLERERTNEDTVLEYIKKQSLLEDDYKRSVMDFRDKVD